MRQGRESRSSPRKTVQCGGVVQGCKRLERDDLGLDVCVDQGGRDEPGASVNDPVRDGFGRLGDVYEGLEPPRRAVGRDPGELQAGRAGVDDEYRPGAQYGQVQSRTSG
jgi:hypothetical protein